jgi:ubiquinone/menaquinone biosynthesis C-methylase UbiE
MNVWALGDYPLLASEVLAGLGPRLVRACEVRAGQRVLDVATGSGLAAVAAAATGASVVGTDITPELLAAAAASSAPVEWVLGDAQSLPFEDGEFDVVLSCLGAIFAPDHQAAADELLRVCRPGGVVGLANWTPEGSVGRFFAVFGAPGPGPAPTDWGSAEHVRTLFGDRVSALSATPETLPVDRFASAAEYCAYYKAHFGPTIAAFATAEDPAELDRRFLAYAQDELRRGLGYDYLLVLARKAG